VKLPAAVGYLELLWHFTAEFAPQGDIGRFTDKRIEAGVSWSGSSGSLVSALIEAGWVDRNQQHRLVVHDWHDHADDAVRKKLNRAELPFLSYQGVAAKVTGQRPTTADNGSLPEPEPEPSQSLATPEPRISATSSSNSGTRIHPTESDDDDAASAFVAGVRKRWEELEIACGRWTAANERIAREQFVKGTSLEEMERVIAWGSIMRFKHCRNKGSDGKIVSLQYHVDCLENDDFRGTSAQQLASMLMRCERDLAQGAA
jgi:hypothetical protein